MGDLVFASLGSCQLIDQEICTLERKLRDAVIHLGYANQWGFWWATKADMSLEEKE